MRVGEVMSRSVVVIGPEETLNAAIGILRSRKIRHLPVVDDSGLIGILTDRDVKRATPSIASGADRDEYDRVLNGTTVRHVMTRDPITVTSTVPLRNAVSVFVERKIGALPVVDDGALVGIVTEIDLLRVLLQLLPEAGA